MRLDRRFFLQTIGGAAASALTNCAGPQTATEVPDPVHAFVPHVVGANTAITSWDFFDAVKLLADIGFRSIEIQNLIGTLGATEGEFPGLEYDKISDDDKARVLEALEPFDHVTVHLPYPADMNYLAP